jgi:hypothetical protein
MYSYYDTSLIHLRLYLCENTDESTAFIEYAKLLSCTEQGTKAKRSKFCVQEMHDSNISHVTRYTDQGVSWISCLVKRTPG